MCAVHNGDEVKSRLGSADPAVINEYLGSSFKHMARYGEKVYKPFMQVCILRSDAPALPQSVTAINWHVRALPGGFLAQHLRGHLQTSVMGHALVTSQKLLQCSCWSYICRTTCRPAYCPR